MKSKKVLAADEVEFWTAHNEDRTKISVSVIAGGPGLTREEFIAALQLFINEMIEGDQDFLANDIGERIQ